MYLSHCELRRNERAFKNITGVTVAEFDELYERFEPAWMGAEEKRLQRIGRQRAIGGGNVYRLEVVDQLLMVLVWLRLYPTTAVLGYFFDLSQPTASRNARRVLAVLRECSEEAFGGKEPPRRGQGRGLPELLQSHPDLVAIIDATEQRIERPQDREQEGLHYSGKRHAPTCKTSIVVNEQGIIRAVTDSAPGRTHDLTQIRHAGVLDHIPLQTEILADAAYTGLDKYLPDHPVTIAHRAHPLTHEQEHFNRKLAVRRILVENVFCQLKHFRILYDCFRHDVTNVHSAVFVVVAAIVNRRTQQRLALSHAC